MKSFRPESTESPAGATPPAGPAAAPRLFGLLRPMVAAALLLLTAWLLAEPLASLLAGPLVAPLDRAIAAWLHSAAGASGVVAARAVSLLHGTAGIVLATAVAAWVLLRQRHAGWLPALFVTVPGGLLLNAMVKLMVQRVRPDWGYVWQTLHTYSFPSGHVAGATVWYGALLVWLWPRLPSRPARCTTAAAAAAMVVLVAFSRIVLGVHYFSDCVGGVVEGALWVWVCLGSQPATARHRTASSRPPPR